MVTLEQIQAGILRYVDLQLAAAFSGWQRAVVLCGGTLFVNNLPALAEKYTGHPAMTALGIYDAESRTFNLDALHEALAARLDGDKIPVSIPALGTIKLGREDIDALCRYIKEA